MFSRAKLVWKSIKKYFVTLGTHTKSLDYLNIAQPRANVPALPHNVRVAPEEEVDEDRCKGQRGPHGRQPDHPGKIVTLNKVLEPVSWGAEEVFLEGDEEEVAAAGRSLWFQVKVAPLTTSLMERLLMRKVEMIFSANLCSIRVTIFYILSCKWKIHFLFKLKKNNSPAMFNTPHLQDQDH